MYNIYKMADDMASFFQDRVFVRATCVPLSENRRIIYGNRITTHGIFLKDLKSLLQ